MKPNDDFYGFNGTGLWITGDCGNDQQAYPIRTNFDFLSTHICEIIFTFIHNRRCTDQGICIFSSNSNPEWLWDYNPTRIAFQIDCGCPVLLGQTTEDLGDGPEGCENGLVEGNTYTSKFVYNPTQATVSVKTYEGTSVSGVAISSLTINETIDGNYRIGLDADQDNDDEEEQSPKSYFTFLSINTPVVETKCSKICSNKVGIKCKNKETGVCTCPAMIYSSNAYIPAITVCQFGLS
jgi:hypothetical protein